MTEKNFIYADNAATTPLSSKALEMMLPYLSGQYANASQTYSFARSAKKAIQQARETIASCIGAKPSEIYFTSGGSECNNWVINGAIDFEMDIVTSPIEHHSILRAVEHATRIGTLVKYLPVTSTGMIELQSLTEAIESPGSFVSVMLANNEIGTLQHIAELADYTHQCKGFFHTDAVQAVGHVKIDVKTLGVDMLSASAHKFNGPKGIGFLYMREGLKWPNLIYGGSQENGARGGTENVASIVGMAVALKESVDSLADNIFHLRELEDIVLQTLSQKGINYRRNGDIRHIPGNLSLSFKGFEGEMLLHRLDLKGIMVSTGSACDSRVTQISHVLKAIGLPEDEAVSTIRISLGHQNTPEEACKIAEAIASIVSDSNTTIKSEEDQALVISHNDNIIKEETLVNVVSINERLPKFYISTIGCNAVGQLNSDGKIIILRGSIIREDLTNTFNRIAFRNDILRRYCEKIENGYRTKTDLPPMSPSAASGLVQGRSSNGKRDWLDKDGKPLSLYLADS